MVKEPRQQLADALEDCMNRLDRGQSLESCLALYPELSGELRPLLVAVAAAKSMVSFTPSVEAKARNRVRLMTALSNQAGRSRRVALGSLRAWAIGSAAAMAIVVGSVATVGASSSSVPGEALYPVKRTVEKVQLMLPGSEASKGRVQLAMARRRVAEMATLAQKGKEEQFLTLSDQLDYNLVQATDLATAPVELPKDQTIQKTPQEKGLSPVPAALLARQRRITQMRALLERDYRAEVVELDAILSQAPPESRQALQKVVEKIRARYRAAIESLLKEEGRPLPQHSSNGAPKSNQSSGSTSKRYQQGTVSTSGGWVGNERSQRGAVK